MPITFTTQPEMSLTVFHWQGAVTPRDWLALAEGYLKSPSRLEIHDMRAGSASGFSYDDFKPMMMRRVSAESLGHGFADAKTALVTADLETFHMAEMFCALAGSWGGRRAYAAFSTMGAARDWLGVADADGADRGGPPG